MLPFSHTIVSIGYPAAGHFKVNDLPATAEMDDMGLI